MVRSVPGTTMLGHRISMEKAEKMKNPFDFPIQSA